MKLISQGAEARLYQDNGTLIKKRVVKSYRLKAIDIKLRIFRTKREAKILQKLGAINFPCPRLKKANDSTIWMDFIHGSKVRDILEKKDYKKLAREIGKKIALLHNNNIIHGDLTTSNLILNREIYFIDFGLSFFSQRIEDKAVDLHLFRQALESKHYTIWKECFQAFINAYKRNAKESKQILKRFQEVESRGRYKKH